MATFVEFMLSFVAKHARRRTRTCVLDQGVSAPTSDWQIPRYCLMQRASWTMESADAAASTTSCGCCAAQRFER
jgi:hypothetical protein